MSSLPDLEVDSGCHIVEGGRPYQEDRCVVVRNLNQFRTDDSGKTRRMYFAIFDGHGGHLCSDYLSNVFHRILANHPKLTLQPMQALQEVWASMDNKCHVDLEQRRNNGVFPRDGSTATVCLIINNEMYCTNCGDSGAILVRPETSMGAAPSSNSNPENFTAPGTAPDKEGRVRMGIKLLTEDHGTHNPDEVSRCTKAGGSLVPQMGYKPSSWGCISTYGECGKPRLQPGGLLVTRAFGDFYAKDIDKGGKKGVVIPDPGRIHFTPLIPKASKSPKVSPKVSKDNTPREAETLIEKFQYIILASDGVWDALTRESVARYCLSDGVDCELVCVSETTGGKPGKRTPKRTKVTPLPSGGKAKTVGEMAEDICKAAVASTYWIEAGCGADNTSCIVLKIRY